MEGNEKERGWKGVREKEGKEEEEWTARGKEKRRKRDEGGRKMRGDGRTAG